MELVDRFGRTHNNLRISVTDRCNLRCVYCMPEDISFVDRSELLSFEEIAAFVRVIAPMGVDKIRLTGGEPLLRRGLPILITMLREIPGINRLNLTTNGILLSQQIQSLHDAGLNSINVSLDTLDPTRFRELSRRDGVDRVVDGIIAAKQLGFQIKVNAVAIRGYIEHDLIPLATFCREHGIELRLIEYMPIGAEEWEREKLFPAHEILELLDAEVAPLRPAADYDPKAPAMEFEYLDGRGKIGIIASVSKPFCKQCNRLRLTADGKFRNCLFALDETDVKLILRAEPFDTARLREAIRGNVAAKWEGHQINSARFVKPLRTMHTIGG